MIIREAEPAHHESGREMLFGRKPPACATPSGSSTATKARQVTSQAAMSQRRARRRQRLTPEIARLPNSDQRVCAERWQRVAVAAWPIRTAQ